MGFRRSLCLGLVGLVSVASGQLGLQTVATGLSSPIAMIQDPTEPNRFLIVQQRGRVRVLLNGSLQATDYLDLTGLISVGGERGLLGLAFHPNYATNGHVFVNFTEPTTGATRIVRYTRSTGNPGQVDPATASNVLRVEQPYSNHNGGTIAFGADGYLYLGMGDGGSGNDPENRAQNPAELLGKMLRIDVDRDDFPTDPARNYGIPSDNPFVGGVPITAAGEIWAFGVRNPWKWSFDEARFGGLDAMLIGDVGQNAWEEVNYEPRGLGGRNYGWRMMEGTHPTGLTGSAFTPWVNPLLEYDHSVGSSITGGYLYRGTALGPTHYGRYFFADYVAGRVWSTFVDVDPLTKLATLGPVTEHTLDLSGTSTLGNVSSFAVDDQGELYVVRYAGSVAKIVPDSDLGNVASGHLSFGGFPAGAPRPEVLSMEVRPRGSVTPDHVLTFALLEGDAFRFPVPASSIDLSVKPGTFLRRTVPVDAGSGDVSGVLLNLVNGDVDGNNTVNIADFVALRRAFGSSVGGPGYSPGADLNKDGSVNVADFIVLRSGFGQSGDA
ncbi:MAG: PQQ-dependent sugar dehydrogenase [Fimbriimonadaceae bacterium]|nr:PQQ-dependent sugar dehydrogenase [Fimbriimonadaceae bacterium]